jgi:hypothetical protein
MNSFLSVLSPSIKFTLLPAWHDYFILSSCAVFHFLKTCLCVRKYLREIAGGGGGGVMIMEKVETESDNVTS